MIAGRFITTFLFAAVSCVHISSATSIPDTHVRTVMSNARNSKHARFVQRRGGLKGRHAWNYNSAPSSSCPTSWSGSGSSADGSDSDSGSGYGFGSADSEAGPADTATNSASGSSSISSSDTGTFNIAPSSSSGISGAAVGSHTGQLTWYATGMGSCGWTNTDSDMIAAVSHTLYDQYTTTPGNPNNNDLCGKMIDVSYGGKTVRVKIVDRCEGCQEYDVDLTTTAFSQLADLGVGRLSGATWQLV